MAVTFPWRGLFSSLCLLVALYYSKRWFPAEDLAASDAISLCRQHMKEWHSLSDLSDEQFSARKLLGGTTHSIFRCDAPKGRGLKKETVVLRVFRGADVSDRDEEARLQQFLGDRDLGVQILADFGTGRIEEFVTGKPPSTPVFAGKENPQFAWAVAETFGRLHRYDENDPEMRALDINKNSFLEYMNQWLEKAQQFDFEENSWKTATPFNRHKARLAKVLDVKSSQWNEEVSWAQKFVQGLHHDEPLVLSHNDMNGGNVLTETVDSKVLIEFIDYEYGGMNYRGFDLGNYFCEHFLDYSDNEWPHFTVERRLFPEQAYTLEFIRHYLAANSKGGTYSHQNVTRLYVQSMGSMLTSHLLWSVWGFYQSTSDASGLGFLETAITRREEYDAHKALLLEILEESTGSRNPVEVLKALESFDDSENGKFLGRMNDLHLTMTARKSVAVDRIRKEFKTTRKSLGLN